MTSRLRTRVAVVLLIVALVVVLPGGEYAYYLPKLAIGALAIAAAAFAPATGRLPRLIVWIVVAGAAVLLIAALTSASALPALLGRAPRYEGLIGLSVYAGMLWAGARVLSAGADVATLRFFRRGLSIASILIALLYVVEAAGLRPLGGSTHDRTGSLLGNATDAGLVGVILFVLLLGTLFVDRAPIVWAGAVGAAATVGISESRAAVLSAGIAFVIAVVAILVRTSLRSRAVVIAIVAIPVAVTMAVLVVPGALHRMTGGSAGKSAAIRMETWTETLDLIGHHWALGVGPSGFVDAILPYQGQRWADLVGFETVIDSPHNLALQALSAGGALLFLVGFALLVVVALRVIRALRAAEVSDHYVWTGAGAAAVAGTLVGLLTHFSTPSILMLLLPVLGGLVATPIVAPKRAKGAPVGRVSRARDASLVWLPAGLVLTVVLVAAAVAEVPLRVAIAAAAAGDASAAADVTSGVRLLRGWDADAISSIAQAAAQGADSATAEASGRQIAALAASDGLEARSRLGGSAAPTLAAAIGLAHQGATDAATTLFDELIATSPFDDSLYVRRGVLRAQSGSTHLAILDFKAALKINPHNKDARTDLAIVRSH